MPSTPFAYPQVKLQIRDGVRFAAAPLVVSNLLTSCAKVDNVSVAIDPNITGSHVFVVSNWAGVPVGTSIVAAHSTGRLGQMLQQTVLVANGR